RAEGEHGRELVVAHWKSETSLYRLIPEFIPRPVAFGTYKSQLAMHFFLLEFVDMIADDIPDAESYLAPVAALHLRSMGKSPTGMFGFSVETKFGDLPQPTDWEASWEVWWTRHMRFVVDREERIRGPRAPEDAKLVHDYLVVVLPRYLRPLETNGRSIQPTLCHGDMWPGNVRYKDDNESVVIFDANACWYHNEVELAPLRNPRYPLGESYIEEYRKHIPPSEPSKDADSRIVMYMIRNQVQLASLYPNEKGLRDAFLGSMRFLVDRVLEETESLGTI
ncbi:Fructosamine kinase-domain-containing protein, partial [Coniochaeta sp. 2T2.1]